MVLSSVMALYLMFGSAAVLPGGLFVDSKSVTASARIDIETVTTSHSYSSV